MCTTCEYACTQVESFKSNSKIKVHLNYASLRTSWENTVREQIEIKSNCFKYVSKKCYHLKSKNILSTIISDLEKENSVKPCITTPKELRIGHQIGWSWLVHGDPLKPTPTLLGLLVYMWMRLRTWLFAISTATSASCFTRCFGLVFIFF